MVISPFSTFAGQARSVASAPQAGEACVLTDQEIEEAIKRLSARRGNDEEDDMAKLRRFSGESAAIARLHDEGQASLAPRQLDDFELDRAMNESEGQAGEYEYQTYLSEGEGTASEEWRQDRSLNTESPRLHAALSGSLDSLRSSSGGGAEVLQALHAMLEKSCQPEQPATGGGQAGQLPFRRSSSASQAVAIRWRSQLRGDVGSSPATSLTHPVLRGPPSASKRSRHLASARVDAGSALPASPSATPVACVLPAVGTWAGRTNALAMDTDHVAEEPSWEADTPLRDRRSSSVDGRIEALRSALEPPAL